MGGRMQRAVNELWRLVVENPRRSIHSLKVGLALAVTSATVLEETLYGLLGDNAIWSVMSVVVVFELTAGATIYKGLNRALGTLLAGMLALGVEYLADFAGTIGEPYVVGLSILIIGTISTYTRFCEPFKSNYDYGVMIFLLTFSLIIVSSYRVADYPHLALSRFLNIVLGGAIALMTNMLIKPIWASQELHNIIWTNFHNLAKALEGFTDAYIKEGEHEPKGSTEDDPVYDAYNILLSSKNNEESLANYATWEPWWKGQKGPLKQYVKVGGMLRNCTYTVASLHGCMTSNKQVPYTLRKPFSTMCEKVATESIAVLKRMGDCIEKKERSERKDDLMKTLFIEVGNLKQVVSSFGEMPFVNGRLTFVPMTRGDQEKGESFNVSFDREETIHEILAVAAVAYFLIELVPRLSDLVDSVKLLEKLASFRVAKDGPNTTPFSLVSFDSLTIQTTD